MDRLPMRLSTRLHGALDYLIAGALIVFPWALAIEARGPESWIPVGAGALLLAYSLATDYELAPLRRLQIPLHLWCDGLLGLFLAVSPWLFAFDRLVWAPHLALGALLILGAFLTDTIPGYERRGRGSPAARI